MTNTFKPSNVQLSLKQRKANVQFKQFPFLTSVKDYIKETYEGLENSLNPADIFEILDEIKKDAVENYLFVYGDVDRIRSVSFSRYSTSFSNDKGESLRRSDIVNLDSDIMDICGGTNLDSIFYIKKENKEGLFEYRRDLELEASAARVEKARKLLKQEEEKEERLKVKTRENLDLAKKYNISPDNFDDLDLARKLEASAKATTPEQAFIAAKALRGDASDELRERIEEIAYEAAESVVSDHYYDEH